MIPHKRLVAVLLAVAAPVIGRAGPTLYDMQHSSVLRQRLPPYLRVTDQSAKSSERKEPEKAKQGRDDDANSAGPAGTSGTTTTEPGAGKK